MKKIIKSKGFKQAQSNDPMRDLYEGVQPDMSFIDDVLPETRKTKNPYPRAEEVKSYYDNIIDAAQEAIKIMEGHKQQPSEVKPHAMKLEEALVNFVNNEFSGEDYSLSL